MSPSTPGVRHPFEYAVVRVMPRVDRAEFVNAGVLLYCHTFDYLGARVSINPERVRALDPDADIESIRAALHAIADVTGVRDVGSHFRWLTAPRSTVVQPGPVHTGLTHDAVAELERLMAVLVAPVTGRPN
jgi:hypothetical protein